MGAQVINNTPALLAIDHVSVEAARMASSKISGQRHRLPAIRVEVSIVPDAKGNSRAPLGEHDSPPASNEKKRKGKGLATPDLFHYPRADGPSPIFAAESETLLNP